MSIKDFEVLSKLGQGSFGTVFKVRRKEDGRTYVLKTINIAGMDRRGQEEAANEVHILASLDCPYIVKYYDSFIEGQVLHIIMEYCAKGDLAQLLKAQGGRLLSESRIWKFFLQMCLSLEYLHAHKILHRDIKSMNVFLADKDSVRIGDLGVAKVLSNTAAYAHTMVGTPYYLSPELCEERPYNAKSDVWALGCVLYELCTLKPPFDAMNQGALILKIIRGKFAPISETYSAELRELSTLLLAKDHRKRPTVRQILSRPGLKEKADELGVAIPQDSVLSQVYLRVQGQLMTPNISVRPILPTIEEEHHVMIKELARPKSKVLPSRPIKMRHVIKPKKPSDAPVPKKKHPVPAQALKPVSPIIREFHRETQSIEDRRMQVIEQPSHRPSHIEPPLLLEDVPEILNFEENIALADDFIPEEVTSCEEVKTDEDLASPQICSPESTDSYSDSFERAEEPDSDEEPPRVTTPTQDQAWLYGLQEALAASPGPSVLPPVVPQTPEISEASYIPTVTGPESQSYTVVFPSHNESSEYQYSDDEPYDEEDLSSPELRRTNFQRMIESHKTTIAKRIGAKNFSELYSLFRRSSQNEDDLDESQAEQLEAFVKARVSSDSTDVMHDLYKLLHLEKNL